MKETGNMGGFAKRLRFVAQAVALAAWAMSASAQGEGLRLVRLAVPESSPQVGRLHELRLAVVNEGGAPVKAFLEPVGWPEAYLYAEGADSILYACGRMAPKAELHSSGLLPVALGAGERRAFRLVLHSRTGVYLPEGFAVRLLPEAEFRSRAFALRSSQLVFATIMLTMALYNLLIYSVVRDGSYGHYVLSILGVTLYFAFLYGYARAFFWPDAVWWDATAFGWIVPLTHWARIGFTRAYLRTDLLMPKLDRAYGWFSLAFAVPLALWAVGYAGGIDLWGFERQLIGALGLLNFGAMLALGLMAQGRGYEPAKLFNFANLVFIFGSVLFVLREVGLLPDVFLTRYVAQVGAAVQVVFFSMGLAYRLNRETRERERLARQKDREIRELTLEKNRELEETVEERTEELQQAVEKLSASEEGLRKLNAVKDRMFSIISHDLRSPMASMNSFFNILLKRAERMPPEELRKLSVRTKQSVESMTLLLDNLLQWSRTQMESQSPRKERVEVKPLLNRNIVLFLMSAETKDVQIVSEARGGAQVFADRDMLDFAVRNLVMNAVKFTAPGGYVYVYYRVLPESEQVEIVVRDTGVGIPPDRLEKLFDPQERVSTRGTQQEKGSGLGLLLCKEFAELNGGTLTAESQVGKGSTFRIRLPLAP